MQSKWRLMNLQDSLGFAANRLAGAMALRLQRLLEPHGITTAQWAILAVLWRKEGLAQVDLQRILGLSAPTITGLLRRMERDGFLYRETDPADRRVQRVFPTVHGRELKSTIVPLAQQVNEEALRGFSSDERGFLQRLLLRAVQNVGGS
jgi:MarR family transcriptional regulator, organic hydroperoxide resistance regulator